MAKRTTIYLDDKVYKKALSLAKKEGRSLSNYLTCLILDAIEEDKIFWDDNLKKFAKRKVND